MCQADMLLTEQHQLTQNSHLDSQYYAVYFAVYFDFTSIHTLSHREVKLSLGYLRMSYVAAYHGRNTPIYTFSFSGAVP